MNSIAFFYSFGLTSIVTLHAPHSRQEKPIDKTLCTCYNTWELTEKFPISYRGVEQLEARRAHNPEVVGSSPASATKIIPDFGKKSGIFLTFVTILPRSQIHFGDSLGIAQNQGWENPNIFIEDGFSVNSAIFSPQTPPPGHPQLLLWQWQSGVRKSLLWSLRLCVQVHLLW